MNKENIFVSFSGGKTSAYMSKLIMDKYKDNNNVKVIFSNTGQEHEKTLEFVDKCDKAFNLNVIWVESVIHHDKRKGATSRVTDYVNATRDHKLFEEMIKKYGLPNRSYLHCTRELKTNPMHHYVKNVIGWKAGTYYTAIGIRSDEIDRVNPNYEKLKYWYPLANLGVTKMDVNKFWEQQDFNLEIPSHYGNCTWCWKKNIRKHMALIDEIPEIYDVPKLLEEKYGDTNAKHGKRVMFRENRSAEDLFNLHKSKAYSSFEDEYFNDCKESCEAF